MTLCMYTYCTRRWGRWRRRREDDQIRQLINAFTIAIIDANKYCNLRNFFFEYFISSLLIEKAFTIFRKVDHFADAFNDMAKLLQLMLWLTWLLYILLSLGEEENSNNNNINNNINNDVNRFTNKSNRLIEILKWTKSC